VNISLIAWKLTCQCFLSSEKIKEELEEVKSKMDTISEKMENLVTSEQASKDEGQY